MLIDYDIQLLYSTQALNILHILNSYQTNQRHHQAMSPQRPFILQNIKSPLYIYRLGGASFGNVILHCNLKANPVTCMDYWINYSAALGAQQSNVQYLVLHLF